MDRNYFEAVFRVVRQICTMAISFVCTFKNNLCPLTLTSMTCVPMPLTCTCTFLHHMSLLILHGNHITLKH